MPDGGRLSLDYYDRMTGDMGEGGRPDELHQDVRSPSDAEMMGRPVPSRGVRLGYRREFAEGGLVGLAQKYEGGGRVRRIAGAVGRAVRGRDPEAAENPRAVIGGNRPTKPATMTPEEAMARATAPQPGAGVPRLEGEDLERANELSQRVLDFRASQMRLPPSQRIQARPEDQIFAPARFDRPLEAGPTSAAQDLEALRIENISPRQQLPGSRAGAGVATDLAENYGPALDRIVEELGPVARLMRGENLPDATAAQIAAARSGEFYNMRPVYDVLRAEGVPHDEAIRRIRQESQAIAGTSPRTDTEQNVLNSAFLQNRMARGLPVDAASVQAATGPGSGYGMIYDQHPALTQGLLEGTISLAQNPKPSIFARNISGDRSAVTADVHNVRAVNMLYNDVNPGGLPASSFDTANNYRRYREAYTPDANGNVRGMNDAELREILVARPSGQGIRGQDVSTEYPIYNDITTRVAERLDLTPADTQALMWFHYGPRTGLASEAHTVPELLNQRMSITAQGLGMSPEEVMRLYSRNMIPLAGAAPAAVLLSDGEPRASLEDLDQKYAEGGRVRRTLRDELRDIEAEIRGERPQSLGVTVARGMGEGGGGIAGIVSPATARAIRMSTRLPQDSRFVQAVENTPGARIDDDGLSLEVLRYQKPEQAGAQAIREGVFYLPATLPSRSAGSYRGTNASAYGGPEVVRGETLLRAPIAVPGNTGGTVPERVFRELTDAKTLENLIRDSRSTALAPLRGGDYYRNVEDFLETWGGNPALATELVNNSRVGNRMRYALQEHIIGNRARQEGYDSIIGTGARKPRITEVFDLREAAYPVPGRPEIEMLLPYFDEMGYAEGGLAELGQKYAEGGEVRTPEEEEYDNRLLSRMKAHTGRVTEPTRAEQMQALRMAGRGLADTAADILTPGPEDFALAVLFGPGARAVRIAGAGLLASMKPSEAYDDALLDALYNDLGRALPPQPRDPEIIDITRRYAEGGLAQLDQKYAEGGVVRSEAATYDPDAVDALVKQIEAEYV
jgi:hypothetical protein